jgi:HlyD family secretion protein
VAKVAEKGHDEFELFSDETTDLTGRANRQVFDVEVNIKGQSPILRIGLRSDVEIEIRAIENALVVPRTAIVRERDGTLVVHAGEAKERRPVKVQAENELYAAVEGVKAGERVWIVGVQ